MIGRIPVLDIEPLVDCGRRPAKAVAGETFEVSATVFREGHEAVGANVVLRDPTGRVGPWTPLREVGPGTDRWAAEVTPDTEGRWTYTVEAWGDPVGTWRQEAAVKIPAGVDTELTLEAGALLHERAAAGVPKSEGRSAVLEAVDALRDTALPAPSRLAAALAPAVTRVLERQPLREMVSATRPLPLQVERRRALFGSWYEMFPRSEGAVLRPGQPPVSGTLRSAAERLEAVAGMGFDVVYLPPIHPIGETHRKGPGNALAAGADDVGCPWAIGSAAGGHDAIHPDLGTLEDFDAFVARARSLRMEVALDFALQCSPDHPWVKEHPEWFRRRADGSIAHAENPPKKYQDIYPLSFDSDAEAGTPGPRPSIGSVGSASSVSSVSSVGSVGSVGSVSQEILRETLRVLRFWMDRGVRIFRVDNPHTKPVVFWERVIAEINRSAPDVVFLAEAFTRPAMLDTLAKVGFQQSYTYFTWRTTKDELTDYLSELAGPSAAYLRPNLFVNTPDILHSYLQRGGRPAFEIRAVLAATLSPSWGMYAGYELCEATAAGPGSEEYLHAEKYELRPRDWAAAERSGTSLTGLITALNRLRRRHPALGQLRSLRFHETDNERVIAYSKRGPLPGNEGCPDTVLVVVNLDPHHTQEATVSLNMAALADSGLREAQLSGAESFPVCDELTGVTYHWGRDNYVRLVPGGDTPAPAHIFALRPPRADRRVTHS